MANTITAGNATNNGTVIASDSSGTLNIVTGSGSGANAITIDASQNVVVPKGVGGTPAFSAYQSSAQTLSSSTYTKLQFQTEEFDTSSCFDSTTNYRFTPNVAGYYLFSTSFTVAAFLAQNQLAIYKNGAIFKQGFNNSGSGQPNMSALIYMNGSTDYVEAYAWLSGGQALTAGAASTYFQGFLARGV
jgi:hypothetical protein